MKPASSAPSPQPSPQESAGSPLRLVVLVSGGGSNLRHLLEAIEQGQVAARVVAIGADRDAPASAHARSFKIPYFTVPFVDYPSRRDWGRELLSRVRSFRPQLVVLSGLMRLLPPPVVRALSPGLINTHPSYLPEFPGAHAVRDAIQAGVTRTGASVIRVAEGVDDGPILCQERVPVLRGDTEATLHERIKLCERRLLCESVNRIAAAVKTSHPSINLKP